MNQVLGTMQVVSDLEKMIRFYVDFLDFKEKRWPEGGCVKPSTQMHHLSETQTIVAVDLLAKLKLSESVALEEIEGYSWGATLTDTDGHRLLLVCLQI